MWHDALIRLKKTSGKTIKEISLLSGVPVGTLNKLFSGQTTDPKLDTVRAVVHAIGYTLDDLDDVSQETTAISPKSSFWNANEQLLASLFRQLNSEGQERLLETADVMVRSGKYEDSDK